MPITYEHRVPASTLGGLALAAGQEQYEAQRGREDRARAVQLAQMAQQQQMQNQRMAYDAASTQYRTAADYNKFVMGAQLDVQQRQRDHQNRLALQNNQDQLAAGREEVRWDRAQEVQGQGDTHQAWKSYVDEVRGTLNQDGIDILDTHSAKYRSIMSNQKFSPGQKSAATAQLLEEVQNENLGQSYAKEIQYEPGKSYVGPKGYKFTVLEDGSHQNLGQNFDDLIKPEEMSDSDWETKGKHVAWLDAHRFGPPGRDKDGRQTHKVEGPDGKLTDVVVEDEQYLNQVLKEEQIEREKEERAATIERRRDRSTFISDYLTRQDNDIGKISTMVNADGEDLSVLEKEAIQKRRMEAAKKEADLLFPEPAAAAGGGTGVLDAGGGQSSPAEAMGEQPSPATSGIPPELLRPDSVERPPLGGKSMTAGGGSAAVVSAGAENFRNMTENIDDPRVKDLANAAYEIMKRGGPRNEDEVYLLRQAENSIKQHKKHAEMALAGGMSLGEGGTAHFGEAYTNKIRRAQALKKGQEEGGMGDIARATEMATRPGQEMGSPHEFATSSKYYRTRVSEDMPVGTFPGMHEDKPPFERTPEQVEAEKDIQARGPRPAWSARQTTYKGSIVKVPVKEYKRPKGEGLVGAAARKPLSESEKRDMAYREKTETRELSKEEKLQDRIKDPKTVREAVFTELWPETKTVKGKAVAKMDLEPGETGSERAGRIYDAMDEWDLHASRMTKERFEKSMQDDPGLRAQYVARLKTKLMIKEGRSGQESAGAAAKARQERFERDYREQRKHEDGQGTLTGGRDVSDRAGPPGVRAKPKVGTEASIARYGLPGKPSPEQVPGDARKFVEDELAGRIRTDRRDMTKELGNLQNYVTAMGLENTQTGSEILKLHPGDIAVMGGANNSDYNAWIEEVQDMFNLTEEGILESERIRASWENE